ncbi:Bro-N domain-containing protein [Pasteurella multocida]|uniref:BRO-N domain-containing protein n=1 Tax=Pasteurella multocida TaxID=747 RepID=UPI0031BA96BA
MTNHLFKFRISLIKTEPIATRRPFLLSVRLLWVFLYIFIFHSERTQEFWFCGSDVCYILGYKNAPDALAKHCKQGGFQDRPSFY